MKRFMWTSLSLFALAATLAVSAPAVWSRPEADDAGAAAAGDVDAIHADLGDMQDMHGRGMGRGGHRGGGFGRGMGGMNGFGAFERLDLTAEQRERITGIREREQRQGIEARARLETAGLDLRKLMRDDRPSLSQINAQIDRIAGMRADLQKSRVAAMLEARNLLTSEQRAKLREGRMERRGPAGGREDSQ